MENFAITVVSHKLTVLFVKDVFMCQQYIYIFIILQQLGLGSIITVIMTTV